MPDAHEQTDIKLAQMEKRLTKIYSRKSQELKASWEKYLKDIDPQLTEARKAYADAKAGGDEDEIRQTGIKLSRLGRKKVMMNDHYKAMVEQTTAELANVNKTAIAYVNGELPPVFQINYNEIGADISQKVKGYSFELVDAQTVKKLITEDKSLLPKKKLNIPKDKVWNTKKINSEILQGILQGESMPKIAKRLQTVTDMNANAAIRNARTMVTGAENSGRIEAMKKAQSDGVILQKQWLATSDSRTRDWHRELDGKTAEIDEPFENSIGAIMFPGDPSADGANVYNCRCTLKTKFIGFEKAK